MPGLALESRGLTVEAGTTSTDERWMREALTLAGQAAAMGEVPVGALVVTADGEVAGSGFNRREQAQDPTAHAEMLAIREAATRMASWRLVGCTLYVTLEPCAMCAGAAVLARIERLVFGASDPKGGFCGSLGDLVRDPRLNHCLEVQGGVLADEAGAKLKLFFAGLRG